MRTTVALDPDVERLVRERARSTRLRFRWISAEASARQGLNDDTAPPPGRAFRVMARPMRLRPTLDAARLGEVGDDPELEAFLATTKRLGRRSS